MGMGELNNSCGPERHQLVMNECQGKGIEMTAAFLFIKLAIFLQSKIE